MTFWAILQKLLRIVYFFLFIFFLRTLCYKRHKFLDMTSMRVLFVQNQISYQ